jgi:hypothetical protein
MSRPNPLQTFTHCWRYAGRRALVDGDAFHIVATGKPDQPRLVLADRALFCRDDLDSADIEATMDPFLGGVGSVRRE